jgi:hypothetical protein
VGLDGLSTREGDLGLEFVDAEGNPVLAYRDLKVWDANGTMLEANMQPSESGALIALNDSTATYPVTVDPLIASLEEKLGPEVAPYGAAGLDAFRQFGERVGRHRIGSGNSGTTTAAGTSTGSAYVLVRGGAVGAIRPSSTASDAAAEMTFSALR